MSSVILLAMFTSVTALKTKAAQSTPSFDSTEAGVVRVIARVKTFDAAERERRASIASVRSRAMAAADRLGVRYAMPIGDTPLIVMEVDSEQFDALLSLGHIAEFYQDRLHRPTLLQSIPLIGGPAVFDTARGSGQTVAILDTGVDTEHPFFESRVVAEACFSSTLPEWSAVSACANGTSSMIGPGAAKPCASRGCFHGTHVAGIAAGHATPMSGIAPASNIVGVQVFSDFYDPVVCGDAARTPCPLALTSDIIRGLDHVRSIAATHSVTAVNLSLGGGQFTASCDAEPVKIPVDKLLSIGVATVAASGNDAYTDAINSPACISSVIAVGSTTKQDEVSNFSNSAALVDLMAPGSSIQSAFPGGSFATASGTSMSAPHVAGAFALLRSASPGASVDDLLAALKTTGTPITDRRNNVSVPRIDVFEALLALDDEGSPGAAPAPVSYALPAQNEIVIDRSFTLAFSPSSNATDYDLHAAFRPVAGGDVVPLRSSYSPTELGCDDGSRCELRISDLDGQPIPTARVVLNVTARNAAGGARAGNRVFYVTTTRPRATQHVSPRRQTNSRRPTLRFRSDPFATRYRVRLNVQTRSNRRVRRILNVSVKKDEANCNRRMCNLNLFQKFRVTLPADTVRFTWAVVPYNRFGSGPWRGWVPVTVR